MLMIYVSSIDVLRLITSKLKTKPMVPSKAVVPNDQIVHPAYQLRLQQKEQRHCPWNFPLEDIPLWEKTS